MLACAACAREKQHLLGQLLKETEIINEKMARPNTGCKPVFVRTGFQVTHSPSQTGRYPKVITGHALLW